MEKRYKLSVEDVYEKQFNIDFKGYCAKEVDEFLDLVIADYQEYDRNIENLGQTIQEYEKSNNELKKRIQELQMLLSSESEKVNKTSDNVDILKRLTRLENAVFAKSE